MCIQAREAIFRGNPQIDAVDEQAVDLVVRQAIFFREYRYLRCLRKAFVHPVQTFPVRACPEGVSVGNKRQTAGKTCYNPMIQGFQVNDVDAFYAAHPQFVCHKTFPKAGCGLYWIDIVGGFAQIVEIQSVVRRYPDIVVNAVVRQTQNDINAFGRIRRTPVRDSDDVMGGRDDIIQATSHGACPDPPLPVFAERRDGVICERRVSRVVVPERQTAHLFTHAVFGGSKPQDIPAVDKHGPDRRGRDKSC